jgi:DNA-binding response OmpR family regulator
MGAERHALVVESDGALAKTLGAALQTCGFQVEVIGDGAQAAERLNKSTPELILLDAEPSLADSICKQVKKKNKATPVMVVSANGDGIMKRLFGRGPDVVLHKPVSTEEVVRHVRQLFHMAAAGGAPAAEAVEELDSSALVEGGGDDESDTDVRDAAAVAKSSTAAFAKEHEVLGLRQRLNQMEKQNLDLREEVDRRERQLLQQKQSTHEVERKVNTLNDTILGLEQGLLTANERIDTLEREEDTLLKSLAAKDQELQQAIATGKETLNAAQIAAADEAKRTKARTEMEHAGHLDRLRKEHEGATAKNIEKHHQETQELMRKHASVVGGYEARLAKAIETIRGNARHIEQARQALSSAGAHLANNVPDFKVEAGPDDHKK